MTCAVVKFPIGRVARLYLARAPLWVSDKLARTARRLAEPYAR